MSIQSDTTTAACWQTAATMAAAFAHSAGRTAVLIARRRLTWPRGRVGGELRFEDGTSSVVFRETVLPEPSGNPATLIVCFRLRLLGTSRVAHWLFRKESIANTPLFAGFPGFRSKLWLTDPRTGVYRGVYEWDGADQAGAYAETLSRLLRLASTPGSVRYHVVPGVRRDVYVDDPSCLSAFAAGAGDGWWRLGPGVDR